MRFHNLRLISCWFGHYNWFVGPNFWPLLSVSEAQERQSVAINIEPGFQVVKEFAAAAAAAASPSSVVARPTRILMKEGN